MNNIGGYPIGDYRNNLNRIYMIDKDQIKLQIKLSDLELFNCEILDKLRKDPNDTEYRMLEQTTIELIEHTKGLINSF